MNIPKTYRWQGKDLTVKELGKIIGCTDHVMRQRLNQWSIEKAMTTPVRTRNSSNPRTQVYIEKNKYDPDLELKRRIKHWQKQNLSTSDMIQKMRFLT